MATKSLDAITREKRARGDYAGRLNGPEKTGCAVDFLTCKALRQIQFAIDNYDGQWQKYPSGTNDVLRLTHHKMRRWRIHGQERYHGSKER
jgi:hypothetical protein